MDQATLRHRSHLRLGKVDWDRGVTTLTVTCPDCKAESELTVEAKPLQTWLTTHTLIQVAFPKLSDFQREQLITGYCQVCWDKMWAYLEDEED